MIVILEHQLFPIEDKDEITDMNVVKVEMDEILKDNVFFKAKDFFDKKDLNQ